MVTATIILHARKRKDGRQAVYLRLYFDGKCKFFPLHRYCLSSEWDEKAGRFTKDYPNWKKENDLLRTYEQRAADAIYAHEREKRLFSVDRFEAAVFGSYVPSLAVSVVASLRDHEAELRRIGKLGTAYRYRYLARMIEAYRASVTFSDITPDWVSRFGKHLRTVRKSGSAAAHVTITFLLAQCRRIATQDGVPSDWQPWKGYKRSEKAGRIGGKRALSLDDFRRFETVEGLDGAQPFHIDLFLLSFYLRGMNLADMARVTVRNLVAGRLEYSRQKTGKEYSVPISEKAAAILDRYAGEQAPYLLPIRGKAKTDRQVLFRVANIGGAIGRTLREVAERLGIPSDNLSFYTARHTYATALKGRGVDVAVISEALGHSDLGTTKAYLARFDASVLDAADRLLEG